MSYSFLPSMFDLERLLTYVLTNPYLFVSSSTVMTTGLIAGALTLGIVATGSRFVPVFGRDIVSVVGRALRWLAPKLALTLTYFGAGSLMLASQILVRFHHTLPQETELQFRSGLGHLALAALGIALLLPVLRGVTPREWLIANFWALGYWALQIALLTPPWFAFQGQLELVLSVAKLCLGIGLAATLYLYLRSGRTA